MPINKDLATIYGRLTAHEFIMEIQWANALLDQPDEFVEEVFRQMINRSKVAHVSADGDTEFLFALGRETTGAVQNFCKNVRARREDLRNMRAKARQAAHRNTEAN